MFDREQRVIRILGPVVKIVVKIFMGVAKIVREWPKCCIEWPKCSGQNSGKVSKMDDNVGHSVAKIDGWPK